MLDPGDVVVDGQRTGVARQLDDRAARDVDLDGVAASRAGDCQRVTVDDAAGAAVEQRIGSVSRDIDDGIGVGAAIDRVGSGSAGERVGAAIAGQRIVTSLAAMKHVGIATADERIVAGPAGRVLDVDQHVGADLGPLGITDREVWTVPRGEEQIANGVRIGAAAVGAEHRLGGTVREREIDENAVARRRIGDGIVAAAAVIDVVA